MPYPSIPFDDAARVAALRRYGILEDAYVPDLDAVTRVAATLCAAPIAMVNLTDEGRAILPCFIGAEPVEIPRELSICEPVVQAGILIHCENLPDDPRWKECYATQGDNPLVRMYASAPLVTPEGHTIGTLCVMDPERRGLAAAQLDALQDLADNIVHLLEGRLQATRLRAALGELAVRASHDQLTGIANREQLTQVLAEYAETGIEHTVLFCDLDRFKPINDTDGHAIGDEALAAVGARLRAGCRKENFVARLGGDEFVMVIHGTNPASAAAMASRIESLISMPIVSSAGELIVGVSIGWALSRPGESPDSLLDRADQSMYDAKHHRSARCAV